MQHLRATRVASAIIPALRLLDAPRAEGGAEGEDIDTDS